LDAGKEDQLSGPPLAHAGHDGLRDPEGAERVEVEQLPDLRDGHRLHRRPHGRTCVAHEDIDPAGRRDGRADRALIRDIELQACHRRYVRKRAEVSRGRDDLVPLGGQLLGDRAADAARRSGNQDPAHV
jgi:hypothetical protein